jgi:hypothetical protein
MMVSQVALTMVLLVGVGLLGRSLIALLHVKLGFETENRLTVALSIPTSGADQQRKAQLVNFHQRLHEKIAVLPGVIAWGGVNSLPLTRSGGNGRFLIEGGKDSGNFWPNYRVATAGYFAAVGIPLLRGRMFDATDGPSTPQVGVISEKVARQVWPGEVPIGQRINTGNMVRAECF